MQVGFLRWKRDGMEKAVAEVERVRRVTKAFESCISGEMMDEFGVLVLGI